MWKKFYNEKYMNAAFYACAVAAATVAVIALGIYFPVIRAVYEGFFRVFRPVVLAMILSYFCNPLMRLAEKYVFGFFDKIPRAPKLLKRVLSLILTYLVLFLIVAGMLLLTIPEIVGNYESLITNITDFILMIVEKADEMLGFLNIESVSDLISSNADELLDSVPGLIATFSLQLLSSAYIVVLTLILSFFMLLYKEVWTAGVKRFAVSFFPQKAYYEVHETLQFANRTFGRYLLGSVFDSLLVGLETFLALSIFGFPYRSLVSVLIGTTNIIPYFGPFIGAVPSFIIILTKDAVKAFWFLVIILVIQQIDGNLINPRIVGETVGISSMWVIIAITVIGGWLGVAGMFIAIPLFTVIYMLVRRLVHDRLKKKGLPTNGKFYESSFSVSRFRSQKENSPPPPPGAAPEEKQGE